MSSFAYSLTGLAVTVGLGLSTPAFSQSTAKPETVAQAPAMAAAPQITKQHVDGGDGPIPNTFFTQLPGVIAQPPQQSAPKSR